MAKFGDFNRICQEVALTLCPLVSSKEGIEPTCYSRNIEIAGILIFQPATIIIHAVALIMTTIMIHNIKSKYTAVGRKEMVLFFYLYMMLTFLESLLISGIIPIASKAYTYFTAVHIGLITTSFWCLLLNGFIGFQFIEDGTLLSIWAIRLSSLFVFGAVTFLAVATFLSKVGLNPLKPFILWIILYVFNGAALVIYIILQIVLVIKTLEDRWPLGDILFGVLFFATGQVTLYLLSAHICDVVKHYFDGLFFGTASTLLAVMMVYKYWDSITKEDLEFSVGNRLHVWEVKESLGDDDEIFNNNNDKIL